MKDGFQNTSGGRRKMIDTIQITVHEGWHEITLNRPDRLNSF